MVKTRNDPVIGQKTNDYQVELIDHLTEPIHYLDEPINTPNEPIICLFRQVPEPSGRKERLRL